MTDILKAVLPWPVSVNAMYGTRNGRFFLKSKGRAFKRACGIILAKEKCHFTDKTDRVWLDIEVYQPDKRKRDISNLIKIVEDSIPWFSDDSQVDKLVIERCGIDPRKKGYIIIKCGAHDGSQRKNTV
jgi:Holliday junction resolvase RusA-like endonuclease